MKKVILGVLSLLATLCVSTACVDIPLDFLSKEDSVASSQESTKDSLEESSLSSENVSEESNVDSSAESSEYSSEEEEISEAERILTMAYALEEGESLDGTYTLTGVVSNVAWTDQGDSCLTMVVGNFTDMAIYCYWLQDSDFVKKGYEITVSGVIKNYQGTVEFDHPELISWKSPSGDSGNSGNSGTSSYAYTDFEQTEKQALSSAFGEAIPFLANNKYYFEEYTHTRDNGDVEEGYNFYTYNNTMSEFNAYLALYTASGYEENGTEVDEYGDTWYCFTKADYFVDCAYYEIESGEYVMDLYVYHLDKESTDTDTDNTTENTDLLTNAGKGLPASVNGVYNVDFTKAKYAENVTDQGYYLDGCPTTGTPQVLVVPVEFSDITAQSKGYSIDMIKKAFNGTAGDTDYYSVHDYYYTSSYGQLDVQFTVLNEWFRPRYNSSYYAKYTIDYYGSTVEAGDQLIMHELLTSLQGEMDLSAFDSDNNGVIDAIVFVNTLEIDADVTFQWAYRYWNIYTQDNGDYYTYDGVCANDYLWASYQFLWETYDEVGNPTYDSSVLNTYTYIHEFGHVLGADDYYDTAYVGSPMGGCDVMDSMLGDHNAYTKFNYGWLTSSRLIVAESSVTVQLEAFAKNGDSIIIASDWDDGLGAYQEYYVLVYYTNEGLNDMDNGGGYFLRDGIVMYHVNASLYKEVQNGVTYYDVHNNNTDPSDDYGTEDNLIEYVKSTADEFTYIQGSAVSASTKDSKGNKIAYTFTVDALTESTATLTFTKNA